MLKPAKPVFVHGLVMTVALVLIQLLLDVFQNSFLLYLPPIGFAFFLIIQYCVQPIMLGALNVAALQRFYRLEDWQTGFWLNGLFLLLAFTTINIIIQTITGLPFSPYIALIDIFLLPYPYGYLGKFSNRGHKKVNRSQPSETPKSPLPKL